MDLFSFLFRKAASRSAFIAIFFFVAVLLSTGSRAQTRIVGYDFDDGTGTGTIAPTIVDGGVTATDYGVGAGLISLINVNNGNSNGGTNAGIVSANPDLDAEGIVFGTANGLEFGGAKFRNAGTPNFNFRNNNLTGAIARDQFMTFTVTPEAGSYLDLTKFTFRTRVNNANTAATEWALFSSIAGFVLPGDAISTGLTSNVATWDGASNNVVVPLSFSNVGSATEFRLYIFGAASGASNSATLFDKVSVFGNVIPPNAVVIFPSPSPVIVDVIDRDAISQLVGSAIPMNLAIGQAASNIHNVSGRSLNQRLNRLRTRLSGDRTAPQLSPRMNSSTSSIRATHLMASSGVSHALSEESGKTPVFDDSVNFASGSVSGGKNSIDPDVVASGKNWAVFASGDFGLYDVDPLEGTSGLDSDTYASTAGIEYVINNHWAVGAGWSHVWSDNKLRNGLGGFDIEGNAALTYVSYFKNNIWGDFLYSRGDYRVNINRNTLLGSTVRAEPDLESHQATLNLGYNIPAGKRVIHGPTFRADQSWGQLDGYSEKGDLRANTIFRVQDYESLITSLGWQINWENEIAGGVRLKPSFRLGYGRENLNQERDVSGTLEQSPFSRVNLGTGAVVGRGSSLTHTLNQIDPGEGWMEVGAGLGVEFPNNFGLYMDYQGRAFQDSAQLHLGTVKASWKW